jgi:hypothetical protein
MSAGPWPCRAPGADPDWWFPGRGDWRTARQAAALCASCPVRTACLAGALARNERHGVWGGVTEHDRRVLKRTRPCRRCGAPALARILYCGDLCRTAARRDSQRAYDKRRAAA